MELPTLPPWESQDPFSNSEPLGAVPALGARGHPHSDLQTGEKIVKFSSKRVGRGGRDGVGIRVVGDDSTAWAEAAALWGGRLEAYSNDKRRGFRKERGPRCVGVTRCNRVT